MCRTSAPSKAQPYGPARGPAWSTRARKECFSAQVPYMSLRSGFLVMLADLGSACCVAGRGVQISHRDGICPVLPWLCRVFVSPVFRPCSRCIQVWNYPWLAARPLLPRKRCALTPGWGPGCAAPSDRCRPRASAPLADCAALCLAMTLSQRTMYLLLRPGTVFPRVACASAPHGKEQHSGRRTHGGGLETHLKTEITVL